MIYRDTQKAYVAGVASGMAQYYDVPVTLVRALFIVTSFLLGLGILAYMYFILIMDANDGQTHLHFQ
jgi:phage shock protein C